jgi:hypothetical protein
MIKFLVKWSGIAILVGGGLVGLIFGVKYLIRMIKAYFEIP